MTKPKYIPTKEAAKILGVSHRTLEKYRVTGEGPPYFKFGRRVLYLEEDVIEWAKSKRCKSTSDGDGIQHDHHVAIKYTNPK